MSFHLPPLRERVQDIAPLVRGMAARFNTKFRKDLFDISPEALAALETFPWPGNIRQLENVVQQAVLVSSGPELLREHLPQPVREYAPPTPVDGNGHHKAADESLLHAQPRAVERNVIQQGAGQERLQPRPRRRGPRHQPRDTVQEDEEVRADAGFGSRQ